MRFTRSANLKKAIAAFRRLRGTERTLLEEIATVARVLLGILSTLIVLLAPTVSLGMGGYFCALLQWTIVLAIILPSPARAYAAVASLISAAALSGFWIDRYSHLRSARHVQVRAVSTDRTPHAVNWLIPEEDGIFLASRFLVLLKGITSRENQGLFAAYERTYAAFRARHGDVPTPLVATTLMLQSGTRSDMLVFEAPHGSTAGRVHSSKQAVIFLHGFGGNWSLLCALVADAVATHGMDTYCPSLGLAGMWSEEPGPSLVHQVVQELRSKGYEKIILAGLSNGAVGAAVVAAEHQDWFNGLILLFGAHPDTDRIDLPTLYIFGTGDERFPPNWIGHFADQQSKKHSRVEIERLPGADHFALIKRSAEIQKRIQLWLTTTFSETPIS